MQSLAGDYPPVRSPQRTDKNARERIVEPDDGGCLPLHQALKPGLGVSIDYPARDLDGAGDVFPKLGIRRRLPVRLPVERIEFDSRLTESRSQAPRESRLPAATASNNGDFREVRAGIESKEDPGQKSVRDVTERQERAANPAREPKTGSNPFDEKKWEKETKAPGNGDENTPRQKKRTLRIPVFEVRKWQDEHGGDADRSDLGSSRRSANGANAAASHRCLSSRRCFSFRRGSRRRSSRVRPRDLPAGSGRHPKSWDGYGPPPREHAR